MEIVKSSITKFKEIDREHIQKVRNTPAIAWNYYFICKVDDATFSIVKITLIERLWAACLSFFGSDYYSNQYIGIAYSARKVCVLSLEEQEREDGKSRLRPAYPPGQMPSLFEMCSDKVVGEVIPGKQLIPAEVAEKVLSVSKPIELVATRGTPNGAKNLELLANIVELDLATIAMPITTDTLEYILTALPNLRTLLLPPIVDQRSFCDPSFYFRKYDYKRCNYDLYTPYDLFGYLGQRNAEGLTTKVAVRFRELPSYHLLERALSDFKKYVLELLGNDIHVLLQAFDRADSVEKRCDVNEFIKEWIVQGGLDDDKILALHQDVQIELKNFFVKNRMYSVNETVASKIYIFLFRMLSLTDFLAFAATSYHQKGFKVFLKRLTDDQTVSLIEQCEEAKNVLEQSIYIDHPEHFLRVAYDRPQVASRCICRCLPSEYFPIWVKGGEFKKVLGKMTDDEQRELALLLLLAGVDHTLMHRNWGQEEDKLILSFILDEAIDFSRVSSRKIAMSILPVLRVVSSWLVNKGGTEQEKVEIITYWLRFRKRREQALITRGLLRLLPQERQAIVRAQAFVAAISSQ